MNAPKVKEAVAAAAIARRDVAERVSEVNRLTEREVLGAAQMVNDIVGHATAGMTHLKSVVAAFEGRGGHDGVARAVGAQTEMVRAFVDELVNLARVQAEATVEAQRSLGELGRATRAIDGLASEAKILALNSRIEAGRAGGQNRAFSVVSDEMRRLSTAVAATNTKVRELSGSVTNALGQVVAQSQNTRARIERFAAEAQAGIGDLLAQVESFRANTKSALEESDRNITQAVGSSHGALSHLQFQDVVAQGLMRLDARLRELQVQLCQSLGVPEAAAVVAAPAHHEVGGDKGIAHSRAGDVQLL